MNRADKATKRKQIIQLYRLGLPTPEIYKRLGTSAKYTLDVVKDHEKTCEQVTLLKIHDMVVEMMLLMRKIPGVPATVVDQRLAEIKERHGDDYDLD
jgi:hypothetical protein